MTKQTINVGAAVGDGTGDPARTAFGKVNDNFTELYDNPALTAIDRTVFAATIVDTVLYDTSKDSDGGAWRKRCSHTSWENETLSGNWLGSAANEAAARAISGATTGSYYYDTTAAVFRTLNAGSGVTAAYRGNVRQFPAKVLITVEAARVIIWDLTQAGVPMWMVIVPGVSNWLYRSGADNSATAATAANGVICVAMNPYDLYDCQLASDKLGRWYSSASSNSYKGRVADRHSGAGYTTNPSRPGIVDRRCNDVAMTVLPNALIDVATGLPVPTIAVATDGGVSVIKDDGSVWDITETGLGGTYDKSMYVAFTKDKRVIASMWNTTLQATVIKSVIPTADKTVDVGTNGTASDKYIGGYATSLSLPSSPASQLRGLVESAFAHDVGVVRYKENPGNSAAGMVAYITKDYNSGWQVGAIKGAWLADTVAETLTGAELVTNGTFATDTAGWSADTGSTIASVSGELEVTATGASSATASQTLTTVIGKTYVVSGTFRAPSANTGVNMARIKVYDSASRNTLIGSAAVSAENATQPFAITFTATATNTTLNLDVATMAAWGSIGDKAYFDNISCRLADVDRSVKGKGLQVFGSLTKAAVASGAQLMGYSGFSAANYLEQPYNSDLDFGTAAFAFLVPIKEAANSADEVALERAYYTGGAYSGARIRLEVLAAGTLKATFSDGTNSVTMTSSAVIDDATWKTGVIVGYDGTNFRLIGNGGADLATATARGSVGSLTNVNAVLRVGLSVDGNSPLTNGTLALPRPTATWPSAEQINHIYETERPLFEANAQCCLAGTSNAITALAYDDETDLLHVGTSYGRSAIKGLVRVSSEATPVGAITALAAGAGIVAQAGATAVDVYVPAYTLREELLRDAEQMARFGQNLVAHDFTATASQTTFTLPVGWEVIAVYQQGALKRETTSWTRSFDGFKWSVVLGTGATVSDWISILAKRV